MTALLYRQEAEAQRGSAACLVSHSKVGSESAMP